MHTQSGTSQVTVHTHRYLCTHMLQELHGEGQDFGGSEALPPSFGSVGSGELRHSDDQKAQKTREIIFYLIFFAYLHVCPEHMCIYALHVCRHMCVMHMES